MYKETKPKLSTLEQINHLVLKGVKFNITSKEEAIEYLSLNNNYFKLTSYRKSFAKHPEGDLKGQYIELDFAYLKDLAIIDMKLRYTIIHMALDIEHFSKVRILKYIENSKDDGYKIVKDYIDSLSGYQSDILNKELNKVRGNPYCGDIIEKYDNDFPVWAFVEIITFGRFVSFYQFCATNFNDSNLEDEYYLLLSTKTLRNAVAHSNCIINNLSPNTSSYKTNYELNRELSKIGISKDIRSRKMSNVRVQQIITLLYTHKKLVTSSGVHKSQCEAINKTIERAFHHIEYYVNNETISTTFNFLKIVIDNWFKSEYNIDT